MNDIPIAHGLTGDAISVMLRTLTTTRPVDLIAWFCVVHVLLDLQREWDQGEVRRDRYESFNAELLPPMLALLPLNKPASLVERRQHLEQLVRAHTTLFP